MLITLLLIKIIIKKRYFEENQNKGSRNLRIQYAK